MSNADIARHKRDEAKEAARQDPANAAYHNAEAAEWEVKRKAAERTERQWRRQR